MCAAVAEGVQSVVQGQELLSRISGVTLPVGVEFLLVTSYFSLVQARHQYERDDDGRGQPTRARRSWRERHLDVDEIGLSREIEVQSWEVVDVIPSSPQGDINISDYLSSEDKPIEFTTVQRWKSICLQHYERLVDHTITMATEYLVFQKVSKDDLVMIERSRRDLPSVRIYYDSIMELLIVKLMVGKAHVWIGNLFCDLLREKVRNSCGDLRALCPMGSFRCRSAMGRQKEADISLVPENRNQEQDWPSVVIEVGVSESLSALRNDAHFWIRNSGGLTRVVILIAVNVQSKMIMIERWGNLPPVYPSHVARLNIRPRMVQCVTIDTNDGVVGAPLDVPSGLIFDVGNMPQGVLATDFSFDANDLNSFFAEFWGMLN